MTKMAIAGAEVFAAGVTLARLSGQAHATIERPMLCD